MRFTTRVRPTLLAPMAVVLLLCVSSVGAHAAPAQSSPRTVRVGAVAVATVTVGTPNRDPSGRCVISWSGVSTVTGGLVGEDRATGVLVLDDQMTGSYETTSYSIFKGSVDGCGTGSMVLYFPSVEAGAVPFEGRVEIRRGSGTADLAGIRGGGT